MNSQFQFEFYEKLYFHELATREQMHSRVQIPITLLTATIGALGFMGQNIESDLKNFWIVSFYLAVSVAAAFIIASGAYCGRSAWGHFYWTTSLAKQWNAFHDECITTYSSLPTPQRDELIHDALRNTIQKKYIECASHNAEINEVRAEDYSNAIYWLFFAVGFTSIAFLIYYFGSLDKSLYSKPSEIKIVSSVPLTGEIMNKQVAAPTPPIPPMPPAPPTRIVKDAPVTHRPPPPPPRYK
jgi:hypothetical protein